MNLNRRAALLALIVVILVAGTLAWQYSRHNKAPAPSSVDKVTLAGPDADGNGVRDDIDQYIAQTYPNSTKTRAAPTQYAQAAQQSLLDANDKQLSIRHGLERGNAIDCLRYIRGDQASVIFDALRAQILNTSERSIAYLKADQHRSGRVGSLPSRAEQKLLCTFNPDTMKD